MKLSNIYRIHNIINQIKETSSRNKKEEILSRFKDDEELKFLLFNVYNPYITFGLKDKKINKFMKMNLACDNKFRNLGKIFEYLKINNTGSDKTIKEVASFLLSESDKNIREFMIECVTKNLKIGMTSNSINKVFNDAFIPKHEVMLAKKYEDYEHKIKGEFGITLKLDGIRCTVIKENGSIGFFTRQGQPIDDLVELYDDFVHLPDNMVYDGELLLVNDKGLSSDDLFRATQKVVRKEGIKKSIEFILFDLLPVDEFKQGKSKLTYKYRMLELNEVLDLTKTKFIKRVPMLYFGNDKSKIYELLDKVVSEGKEGLMVSNAGGYYVTKRSDNLLKVKKMYTMDLEIVEVEEGTGKNKGKLGALIVDYKGFPCGVGSGFSDLQREIFWENRDKLIKRVCEVQYFEESNNQDGGLSLRFPVFKKLREKGKTVSYD